MLASLRAPIELGRFVRSPIAWVLLVCVVVVVGWIASQSIRPSRRDVINAARPFVEQMDRARLARPGRWQMNWECVATTPPPSDPCYQVDSLGRGQWRVRGVVVVHDQQGQRRLPWQVTLSHERGRWFCERGKIGIEP